MPNLVKKRSIRRQMSTTMLAISLLVILILGIVTFTSLFQMRTHTLKINGEMGTQAAADSRAILENEALDQLAAIAASTAGTVDANIQSIMSQVDILAASAEKLYASPESFGRIEVLPPNTDNQGLYVAQIVYAERTSPEEVADEVGLMGNLTIQMNATSQFLAGAGTTQLGTESGFIVMCDENSSLKTSMGYLDPVERSWYRSATDSGQLVWSDAFEDAYGRGLAVTCGKPVYGPDGEIRAVISIGSTLDDIGTAVTKLSIGETGYAFVVDRSGQVIMSRDLAVDSNGHVVGTRNLLEEENPEFRLVAEAITAGERGVSQVEYDGVPVYLAYEPMLNMPWSVVTVVSVDEVLAPALESEARISDLSSQVSQTIVNAIRIITITFTVTVALAMLLAVALARAAAHRITSPLSRLTEQVEHISGGNLNTRIDIQTGDEIQTLAEAFNTMTASLQQYIHDLTSVTAEKERIGAELNVATQIQKDMLPNIFPAFPTRQEFDIYASMDPAKEVGGDFYDFFMVDEDHLAVVMADVSGKGVPAALFMVIAKTIIKNQALAGDAPDEVFIHANDQLCENNGEGLFVTAFMGLLDLKTGAFTYVNAGHNAPLLRRKNGTYEYLQVDPGFVLAGLEGMTYSSCTMTLGAGDTLFLYTDGVTEALDANQQLYGETRLRDALNAEAGRNLPVTELLPYLHAELEAFSKGAEQADDITMLGLTYRGSASGESEEKTLSIPAQRERLDQVQSFVEECLTGMDCDSVGLIRLQIAVEEIFVNIASYAYAPDTGEAVIICRVQRDPASITIQFRDRGKPFDPLAKKDADIHLSAEERDIGGLGIHITKEYMDELSYAYEDGQNVLTIRKNL